MDVESKPSQDATQPMTNGVVENVKVEEPPKAPVEEVSSTEEAQTGSSNERGPETDSAGLGSSEKPETGEHDGVKQDKMDVVDEGRIRRLEVYNAELQSRLEKLEGKAGEFGNTDGSKDSGDSKDKNPGLRESRLRSVPKLNRMTVEEYRKRKFEFDKPHYSIDAVMSDSAFRSAKSKETTETSKESVSSPTTTGPAPVPRINQTGEDVRFIQINSQALATVMDLYDEITGDNIVIFSPFKSLTYRERQMRESLARLEEKYSGVTWDKVDAEADSKASKSTGDHPTAALDSNKDTNGPTLAQLEQIESNKVSEDLKKEDAPATEEPTSGKADGVTEVVKLDGDQSVSPDQDQLADGQTRSKSANDSLKPTPQLEVNRASKDGSEDRTRTTDEAAKVNEDDLANLKLRTLTSEDRGTDGLKAYDDLKCLLEFYEEYVKPRWDFLRSSQAKMVRYGDLCTVFQPGDIVVHPEQPQKVWRVLKITGGRPRLEHLYTGDFNRAGDSQTSIDTAENVADKEKTPTDDKDMDRSKKKGAEGSSDRGQWSTFNIDGYYIDFDGTNFGAVHIHASIKYFSGMREVKSLRPYPLRFADDHEGLRKKYIANGHRFLDLTHMKLRYYDGRTLIKKPNGAWLSVGGHRMHRPEDISSQVVIDMEKAFQYNLEWTPEFGILDFTPPDKAEWDTKDLDDKDPIKDPERQYLDYYDNLETKRYRATDDWVPLTGEKSSDDRSRFNENEEDLLILPDRVYGFTLRSRRWACFDVREKLLQPVRKDTAYEELQLPEGHKRTLESLVERHFNNKEAVMNQGKTSVDFDFVQGKGLGLIVLLHGSPGVGKTSTAEAIAGKYEKPLLPITCGNLGVDAESVEDKLTENFALAQAWDCIVLLDEADVFLVKRDKNDLKRNALVSVFLRTLEYYTGVLFLTTNRTGAFDEAFRSRIHTALFYPDLGREETRMIWQSNLRRLIKHKESNQQKLIVNEDDIIRFALVHYDFHRSTKRSVWNGRQIRNSFQTAVALAEFDTKEENEKLKAQTGVDHKADTALKWDHFKAIAIASAHFENYLHDARGFNEAELADFEGIRANYPTPGSISAGFEHTQGQPRNAEMSQTLTRISDLHPNMVIPPESSFTNNPFADRTPQKKASLNQRMSVMSQGPPTAMYAQPQQIPQQFEQRYGRGAPSPTPIHSQQPQQPAMYYTTQTNPQQHVGQPMQQQHQQMYHPDARRGSHVGMQQAPPQNVQYSNYYQQAAQPMTGSYVSNQPIPMQSQHSGHGHTVQYQQQPIQSPPLQMSYPHGQAIPMQQQHQQPSQSYMPTPPHDTGQAAGGAQQPFSSSPR